MSVIPVSVSSNKDDAAANKKNGASPTRPLTLVLPVIGPNSPSLLKESPLLHDVKVFDLNDPEYIKKTIEGISKTLENDPKNIFGLFSRGKQYLNLYYINKQDIDSLDKANNDFKAILLIDKTNLDALVNSAAVDFEKKEYQKVINKLLLAKRAHPDSDFNCLMGKAYTEIGKHVEALACLNAAYAKDHKSIEILIALGNLHVKIGDLSLVKAMDWFAKAYEIAPENSQLENEVCALLDSTLETLLKLYNISREAGDMEKASKFLRLSDSALNAINVEDSSYIKNLLGETYLMMKRFASAKDQFCFSTHYVYICFHSYCYQYLEDYLKARDILISALNDPRIDLGEERPYVIMKAALCSYLHNPSDGVYTSLKQQLKSQFPKDHSISFLEGYENFAKNCFKEAYSCFEKYLKHNPQERTGIYFHALNLFRQGLYLQAIQCLKKCNHFVELSHEALELHGTILVSADELKAAKKSFGDCLNYISLDDEHADEDTYAVRIVIANYAYLECKEGKTDEGIRLFKLLKSLDNEHNNTTYDVNYLYAKALQELHRYEEALKIIEEITDDTNASDDHAPDILLIKCRIELGNENDLRIASKFCKKYPTVPAFKSLKSQIKRKMRALAKSSEGETAVPVNKEDTTQKSFETEEQKAEKLKKTAEIETALQDARKKQEEEKQKKADEDRQKIESANNRLRFEKQKADEILEQQRFLKSKGRQRIAVSGSARGAKGSAGNLATDFLKQKILWKNEESKALAESLSQPNTVTRPVSPARITPPPVVEVFNNTLNPRPSAPRSFDKAVLVPIAEVRLKADAIESNNITIPLKPQHIERIDAMVEVLNSLKKMVNEHEQYSRDIHIRLIQMKLLEFISIMNSTKEDPEFTVFFKRIIQEKYQIAFSSIICSPLLVHNNVIKFSQDLLDASSIERLRECRGQKIWSLNSPQKDETFAFTLPKVTNERLLGFMDSEILFLNQLASNFEDQALTEVKKAVFKQSLKNIINAVSSITDDHLKKLNIQQINIKEIEDFITAPIFLISWANNIVNSLTEGATNAKPQAINLDFLDL